MKTYSIEKTICELAERKGIIGFKDARAVIRGSDERVRIILDEMTDADLLRHFTGGGFILGDKGVTLLEVEKNV